MDKSINRIIIFLDHVLNGIILLISGGILLVSGYSLYDNAQIHKNAADASLLAYKPAGSISDGNRNVWLDGQVAWLTIDDTNIDYPVMQGKDNFEYVNKDPYGDFKISGSIFLDSASAGDLSDEYSMIYGHHMERNMMFGSLDFFTSEVYFQNHRTGHLTVKNARYGLDLFAVVWSDAGDSVIFHPEGRTASEVADYIDKKAVINTGYDPGRRIVAFSTCAGKEFNSRLIVFGMLDDRL